MWNRNRSDEMQTFLRRARAGERLMGLSLSMDTVIPVEVATGYSFDYLYVDLEHSIMTTGPRIGEVVRAADASGLPFFVKLNNWDPTMARDMMDMGAFGIMAPFVESSQQALDHDAAIRFPPLGERGWCSAQRSTAYAQSTRFTRKLDLNVQEQVADFANNHAIIIPTIESFDAVENIEELLELQQFPIWHIGAEDLALRLKDEEGPPDYEFVTKVVKTLSTRLHEKGKLLTFAVDIPPDDDPQFTRELMDFLQVDLPYVFDVMMLGYGLQSVFRRI
jgi:4-hydroxy-2-oxoheptanedioate aldolase